MAAEAAAPPPGPGPPATRSRPPADLGLVHPRLWINDNSYARAGALDGLAERLRRHRRLAAGLPSGRELDRQIHNDALMLELASEVVVCSPALAASRGRGRAVHLIPNGVDLVELRRPQGRPADLPAGPVALYQGTLNDGRLDIGLCVEIAGRLSGRASLVLIGPNSLSPASDERLRQAGARLLGPRPSACLPAYMQHADALVVPHEVNPFTESLDPIKAREFVALGRPTVSTPVAGFRDLGPPVHVVTAERDRFVEEVSATLTLPALPGGPGPLLRTPMSWTSQARLFLDVLDRCCWPGGSSPARTPTVITSP